ncbi:hypothetical protein NMG60_11005679 [Bertholletia excelsa]
MKVFFLVWLFLILSSQASTVSKSHELLDQKQLLKNANNKIEGSNTGRDPGGEKGGVDEVFHAKKGANGGSDTLKRPRNSHAGSSCLPANPLTVLSTALVHVMAVNIFFF